MAAPKSDGAASPGLVKYAYMFESNKSPTKQFDALLRAIARFIITAIGDKNVVHLTPKKLSAFYKAVGGDYDTLFVSTPHPTIAYIWQVTGCQHSLQPTDNDYAPPSVPALTPRGFSRWESVEILLGPEEHVPFIQYAVKNWALRHPDTGEIFPPDLPANMFPSQPDAQLLSWHNSCANNLRDEAKKEEADMPKPEARPEPSPERAEPKFTYFHRDQFHATPPRPRAADAEYAERTERTERPFSYVRVGERHGGDASQRAPRRSPEKPPHRERPADDPTRRRSFSDYACPRQPRPDPDTIHHSYSGTYLNPDASRQGPHRPGHARQQSYPRRHSSESSDDDESLPGSAKLRARRRPRNGSSPLPSIRRVVPPPTAPPPPPAASSSFRAHRSDMRPEDPRRRSSPLGNLRDKVSETVSNILPNSRSSSRQGSINESAHSRRSREHIPPSRLSQNHSDLASDNSSNLGSSEDERRRRRRMREERDRGREWDRYRADERGSGARKERLHQRRPEATRRTSSHADIDRRREQTAWDLRDRERLREERKKWDRRSAEEELPTPPGGVAGRRHPEPAYG